MSYYQIGMRSTGAQGKGSLSLPFYLDRRSHLLYGFLYHKLSIEF
ncbi:hypothetical protein [Chamaesiphon sp.]